MFTTLERLFVVKDSAEVHRETHLILCSELSQKYALRIYIALDRISRIEGVMLYTDMNLIEFSSSFQKSHLLIMSKSS